MGTEIQQHRYDAIMRRVGDLKGPGAKVAEVLSELFPVIDLENVPAELLVLGGTRLCMGGGTIGPTAAEANTAQLFNPADSGIIATITSVWVACNGGTIIRWGVVPVERGAAVGTETFADTRLGATASPVCDVREDDAVALADGTNQTNVLANVTFYLVNSNAIAVLGPGTGFEIGNSILNIRLNFGFQWRERTAEPSELNL